MIKVEKCFKYITKTENPGSKWEIGLCDLNLKKKILLLKKYFYKVYMRINKTYDLNLSSFCVQNDQAHFYGKW